MRFLAVFCHFFRHIWHVYLLPIWQAFFANGATMLCKRHEAAPARLRFCGAWPTKTEPSGRRWRRCSRVFMVFSFSAFEWSFCLCAPCPPRSHLSTRATPPRAISPRLFNLGPPARLATCAERGRGPLRTSHSPPPTPYNREPPNVKIPVLSPLHTYPSK